LRVAATPSSVRLSSGDRAEGLSGDELEDLTLIGRDVMDAAGLLPGVVDTSGGRELASAGSLNNIHVLGGRDKQKNFMIDGVPNLDTGSNLSAPTMPPLSTIEELQVMMAEFTAENGRNSGGAITVITRSGSRQFHGSGSWHHRHEEFSANNFFTNQAGAPRPRYRFNVFSYTLGGPIYVPGKFNQDRSKLFFFWSQEYQEQLVNNNSPVKVRVPTALERNGNFSQSFDVNGKLFTVTDPLSNQAPFPGNIIPSDRLPAGGKSVLDIFPLPNYVDPLASNRYQWNYFSNSSWAHPRHSDVARIDYLPKSSVQIYGRYSRYFDQQQNPYASGANFDLTPAFQQQPGWSATLHGAATFSPTFFSELIVGVSQRKHNDYLNQPSAVSKAALGLDIPQWNPSANPDQLIPAMTFGGVPNAANLSLAPSLPWYVNNTIFSVSENLSKIQGAHTVKAGLYFERARKDQSPDAAVRGMMAFDRDRTNPLDANYAYANALLGVFDRYSEANGRPQGHFRFINLEWYVQDNWHVGHGLTLDYGLRFYHDLPQYDDRQTLATFLPGAYNASAAPVLLRPGFDSKGAKAAVDPRTGATFPQGLIGTFVPGTGDTYDGMVIGGHSGVPSGLYTVPALSLAPRFGFAWDPVRHGRTAVRGGIGVFYDRIAGNPTMGTASNPPTLLTPTVYYGSVQGLADAQNRQVLAPPATVTALLGRQHLPTTYTYSIGIEQQLRNGLLLNIAYVGSVSRHLLWERNINPVPVAARFVDVNPQNRDTTAPTTALPANFLRSYQGYGDILLYEFASTSSFNSLQVEMQRRIGKTLRAGFSYSFSKALGSAGTDSTQVSPFFSPRNRNYGPLPYDRTQAASLWYNWKLPLPGKQLGSRTLAMVADHWELSGVTRVMSGAPYTPGFSTTDGQDITGTPSELARVEVVNPDALPSDRWGRPARGDFGNAGVGLMRMSLMNNWDLSLFRSVKLADRKTLQIRFEGYNAFNHTQFSSLNTTARFNRSGQQVDPQFLQPTAALAPRRVQLVIRFNW